jgi:EAL domain-containing protein (putative c-di-GMP-specific phosphodiesterase class I)
MNTRAVRPRVGDAIVVDEVGLESGVYGRYRLRSCYQPIFERVGRLLVPVAVEGLILPHLAGQPVPPRQFFSEVPADDRPLIESMCRALHLRNHHNIGVERLELYFNYDPRADADLEILLSEFRFMTHQLAEIGLDPGLLVCEITQAAALHPGVLVALAAEIRRHGVRIAIDDFGAEHSTLERIGLIRPDIIKVDGGWFRTLCREPAAIRLFATVVAGFRQGGAKVLIAGVEQPSHLAHAIAVGADLFQGLLLGRPALVGTVFDETPLLLAEKLGADPNVLPLFG